MSAEPLPAIHPRESKLGTRLVSAIAPVMQLLREEKRLYMSVIRTLLARNEALQQVQPSNVDDLAVSLIHLSRVDNDLRGIDVLLQLGYPQQAASLGAAATEAAMAVAMTVGDAQAAKRWLEHDSRSQAPSSPQKALSRLARRLSAPKQHGVIERLFKECFATVSAAKHANPWFVKPLSLQPTGLHSSTFHLGPSEHENAGSVARFALGSTLTITSAGLLLVARVYGLSGLETEIGEHVMRLNEERLAFNADVDARASAGKSPAP